MSRRECAELLAAVDAGLLAVTDVVRSAASGAEAAGDLHVSELLAAAGVPAQVHNAETLVHGYLGYYGVVPAATEAADLAFAALRGGLA